MTTASFKLKNGKFCGFCIKGHSGYAQEGSDIVCAAISAMVFLTINNIESFGIPASVKTDDEGAVVDFSLEAESAEGCLLIAGLERELSVLANDFPKFVRVVVK